MLEERFPTLIDKAADRARPAGGQRRAEVRAGGPAPVGGRTAPPAAVTSRPSDEYKVTREGGETIREVAGKALGDACAWKKLYELNPGIDPTMPIPAGTTLRLPK